MAPGWWDKRTPEMKASPFANDVPADYSTIPGWPGRIVRFLHRFTRILWGLQMVRMLVLCGSVLALSILVVVKLIRAGL